MKEKIDRGEKGKILNLIAENPGIYLSKIAKLLDIKISLLKTYLYQLEKNKKIIAIQKAGYTQYYILNHDAIFNAITHETSKEIYKLISEKPGLHLSKIAQLLNMSKPLANYHLSRMEKDKQITVMNEGGFKRYYIDNDLLGPRDKELLSLLRREIPLRIVLYLSEHSNAKHKEILEHLDISPSTLSYHLNNLVKKGIITTQRYGDRKGYNIKNKKEIIAFVLRYQLHIVLDGFKDLWSDLNYTRW